MTGHHQQSAHPTEIDTSIQLSCLGLLFALFLGPLNVGPKKTVLATLLVELSIGVPVILVKGVLDGDEGILGKPGLETTDLWEKKTSFQSKKQ